MSHLNQTTQNTSSKHSIFCIISKKNSLLKEMKWKKIETPLPERTIIAVGINKALEIPESELRPAKLKEK